MTEIVSSYRPLPPQWALHVSRAKIRGYGGAMGGGKSRAGCEETFENCLRYPGLKAVIAREAHTSIVETTKKTMLGQVIPPELIARKKESAGEDFVELFNGSRIHFIGLDDPYRWYSSELGFLFFDESHEIAEEKVLRLITRLRQPNAPLRALVTFNPANPGHWLQRWFILGGQQTEFGFYKPELQIETASTPIGDCEFFFAKASDNSYLPAGYVEQTLGGLPERLRRRYLEGIWEFITGNNFFDIEALTEYQRRASEEKPLLLSASVVGDVEADFRARTRHDRIDDPPRFRKGPGAWTVWRKPSPEKRYVMAIDVSSGGGYDYSGIQIICVDDFEQVAEFQGKLPPAEIALEAYRAGRVFNDALAVPEITGGWGFTIDQELKRLHYPRTYTRHILDRIAKRWTDKTGWDTTTKTRMHMLDTLERVLREGEFGLYSLRTLNELGTFVYADRHNKPQAQDGSNDDLVISLAIAVTVCLEQPRVLRRPLRRDYEPRFAATGY